MLPSNLRPLQASVLVSGSSFLGHRAPFCLLLATISRVEQRPRIQDERQGPWPVWLPLRFSLSTGLSLPLVVGEGME